MAAIFGNGENVHEKKMEVSHRRIFERTQDSDTLALDRKRGNCFRSRWRFDLSAKEILEEDRKETFDEDDNGQ